MQKRRGSAADPISEDDLLRAIEKLQSLGGGYGVVRIGGKQFVRSVPTELNTDTNAIIELAQVGGVVCCELAEWLSVVFCLARVRG